MGGKTDRDRKGACRDLVCVKWLYIFPERYPVLCMNALFRKYHAFGIHFLSVHN